MRYQSFVLLVLEMFFGSCDAWSPILKGRSRFLRTSCLPQDEGKESPLGLIDYFLPLGESSLSLPGDIGLGPTDAHDPEGFPAVFVALSLHQKEYGHAAVSSKWRVPGVKPWPCVLWGEKLLETIYETDWSEMIQHTPFDIHDDTHCQPVRTVKQPFDFTPSNMSTNRQLYAALQLKEGSAGESCHFIHSSTASDKHVRDVLASLHVFRQTFGHTSVRRNWRIPDAQPWPKSMRGKALSGSVNKVRSKALRSGDVALMQDLAILGVLVAEVDNDQVIALEATIRALQRYEALHGSMHVPQTFVVPVDNAEWAQESWGIPLGQRCKKIQSRELFNDEASTSRLREAGFTWKSRIVRTKGWPQVEQALRLFRDLNGHACVPFSFCIPSDDHTWPTELHGLKLGARVSDIRSGRIYTNKRAELDALGFVWHAKSLSFEQLYRALVLYRRKYGHLVVASHFVFPTETTDEETSLKRVEDIAGTDTMTEGSSKSTDDQERVQSASTIVPTELYGFPLGKRVQALREKMHNGKLHMSHIDRLDALGFPWGGSRAKGKQEEGRCIGRDGSSGKNVVSGLTESITNSPGVPLPVLTETTVLSDIVGRCESSMNVRGRDSRGFDEVVMALYTYKRLFGNVLVPSRWIVPNEAPWPQETWGLALGRRVSSIRHRQAYLLTEGREVFRAREKILSDIGFVWDVQRDSRGFAHVYQALVLFKRLNGHLDVPRSFVVPKDGEVHALSDDSTGPQSPVWPEALWGMNLGRTMYDIRRHAAYTKPSQVTLLLDLGVVELALGQELMGG